MSARNRSGECVRELQPFGVLRGFRYYKAESRTELSWTRNCAADLSCSVLLLLPLTPPSPSLLLPPPPPAGSLLQLLLLLAVRVRFPFRAAFPFRSPSSSISRLDIDVLRRCDRAERKDDGASEANARRGRDQPWARERDLPTTTSLQNASRVL